MKPLFQNEAGLARFVCIVFELGGTMLQCYGQPNSAVKPHNTFGGNKLRHGDVHVDNANIH